MEPFHVEMSFGKTNTLSGVQAYIWQSINQKWHCLLYIAIQLQDRCIRRLVFMRFGGGRAPRRMGENPHSNKRHVFASRTKSRSTSQLNQRHRGIKDRTMAWWMGISVGGLDGQRRLASKGGSNRGSPYSSLMADTKETRSHHFRSTRIQTDTKRGHRQDSADTIRDTKSIWN